MCSSQLVAHPIERIHPRSLKALTHHVQHLLETHLWAQITLGMFLGIAAGVALGPTTGWVAPETAEIIGSWLALPGHLFLVLIQMVVIPLVLASVVRGIAASGDIQQLRSTGIGLGVYFLLTTVFATVIGIGVAYVIRPGEMVDAALARSLLGGDAIDAIEALPGEALTIANVPEQIVAALPRNPLGAMAQGEMLQVVLFALILGIALITLEPESSKPLLDLMGSIQKVSMAIVGFVMRIAPLAVFGLLAESLVRTGAGVLIGLGVYALSVVGALLALLLLYLAIVSILGRRNPIRFLADIREPLLLAFSTDSSAATMPVSIRTAEDLLAVRPSTAQLIIPIGATMNMGGTACYHGLATVFMAQLFGVDLPLTALLALITTSLGSSIGAPATPGVGIMILATVLTAAGIPLAGLALIIGLDPILERVRCVMNVCGDLVACVVLDRKISAPQSREAELSAERRREVARARSGADVLTDPQGV
jgi:Na+/H+-dicarboxylate symporter